jgi:hypothetical protein
MALSLTQQTERRGECTCFPTEKHAPSPAVSKVHRPISSRYVVFDHGYFLGSAVCVPVKPRSKYMPPRPVVQGYHLLLILRLSPIAQGKTHDAFCPLIFLYLIFHDFRKIIGGIKIFDKCTSDAVAPRRLESLPPRATAVGEQPTVGSTGRWAST